MPERDALELMMYCVVIHLDLEVRTIVERQGVNSSVKHACGVYWHWVALSVAVQVRVGETDVIAMPDVCGPRFTKFLIGWRKVY